MTSPSAYLSPSGGENYDPEILISLNSNEDYGLQELDCGVCLPNDGDFHRPEELEHRPDAYEAGFFYPMCIGDILKDRYIVIRKLGFGAFSTVWLVHDVYKQRYFAMKALSTECYDTFEVAVLNHFRRQSYKHPGANHVSQLVDYFWAPSPYGPENGTHLFLVFNLMAETLHSFRDLFPKRKIPPKILKKFVKQILLALDYTHKAGVIHTDIKSDNIMIQLPNESVVDEPRKEFKNPLCRVENHELNFLCWPNSHYDLLHREYGIDFEVTSSYEPWQVPSESMKDVYLNSSSTLEELLGLNISLCDWGLASWTNKHLAEVITPEVYRSPEVVLGAPWDSKTDLWTLGALLVHLLEGWDIFTTPDDGADSKGYDELQHLNEIVSYIEPFPISFLDRVWTGGCKWDIEDCEYFTSNGTVAGYEIIDTAPMEEWFTGFDDEVDKQNFVNMLRNMMRVDPHERSSAAELLEEPWLQNENYNEKPPTGPTIITEITITVEPDTTAPPVTETVIPKSPENPAIGDSQTLMSAPSGDVKDCENVTGPLTELTQDSASDKDFQKLRLKASHPTKPQHIVGPSQDQAGKKKYLTRKKQDAKKKEFKNQIVQKNKRLEPPKLWKPKTELVSEPVLESVADPIESSVQEPRLGVGKQFIDGRVESPVGDFFEEPAMEPNFQPILEFLAEEPLYKSIENSVGEIDEELVEEFVKETVAEANWQHILEFFAKAPVVHMFENFFEAVSINESIERSVEEIVKISIEKFVEEPVERSIETLVQDYNMAGTLQLVSESVFDSSMEPNLAPAVIEFSLQSLIEPTTATRPPFSSKLELTREQLLGQREQRLEQRERLLFEQRLEQQYLLQQHQEQRLEATEKDFNEGILRQQEELEQLKQEKQSEIQQLEQKYRLEMEQLEKKLRSEIEKSEEKNRTKMEQLEKKVQFDQEQLQIKNRFDQEHLLNKIRFGQEQSEQKTEQLLNKIRFDQELLLNKIRFDQLLLF